MLFVGLFDLLMDHYMVLDFMRRKIHEHTVFLLIIPPGLFLEAIAILICHTIDLDKVIV